MNYQIDKFKNAYFNFAEMKYRLNNKVNNHSNNANVKDEELCRNAVNSFRQGITQLREISSKNKTTKNSPERATDRYSSNRPKNPNDNCKEQNNIPNKAIPLNRSNGRFVLSSNQSKENCFDNLLTKKIIKIKEKKKENSKLNVHAQTNYLSKIKNKITLETSLYFKLPHHPLPKAINIRTQNQKRTNSILDDEMRIIKHEQFKNINTNALTSNAEPSKVIKNCHYLNGSMDKYMSGSSPKFNSIISLPPNQKLRKAKNEKVLQEIRNISRTAFPSKENSRKNSVNNKKIKNNQQTIPSSDNSSKTKSNNTLHFKGLSKVKMDLYLKKDKSAKNKFGNPDIWNILKKTINFNKGKNGSKSTSRMDETSDNNNKELIKAKFPVTTCHSPKSIQMKLKKEVHIEKGMSGNCVLNKSKPSLELDMSKNKYNHSITDNNFRKINNDSNNGINASFESAKSTMKDPQYYLNEKDKKVKYITQYFKVKSLYPKTQTNFYLYGRLLGKGAFGKVNLGLHILTGRLVAIKSINKKKLTSEHVKEKIMLETSIMKKLRHESIVQIYETFENSKYILIVMELLCAGDLLTYIRKRSKLNESTSKFIFKQIMEALLFIHSQNIVHRDIKLDNILIDLDNNIKICDFGVSRKINKDDILVEQCGTPAYIAPEILKNKGYEPFGVDLWSAGVVLYTMLSGTVPFKGNNLQELHQLILKGTITEIEGISYDANHLLMSLLEIDPKKRITIQGVISHPWLINVDTTNKLKVTLFTNAEKILLAKSNIDFNKAKKEELIEHFTLRNLDSINEKENQNIMTKSIILAPFNSSFTSLSELTLQIENNAIKFDAKAKEKNRNYELNNNGEIDNGIVISPHDSNDNDNGNNINNDIDSHMNAGGSFSNQVSPKPMSPLPERANDNQIQSKPSISSFQIINDKIIALVEQLGYRSSYLRSCIEANEINYATACYYLLLKYNDL